MKLTSDGRILLPLLGAITFAAAGIRLFLVAEYPRISGDQQTYLNFAENLLNGCGWSHSDPRTAKCILSFGAYFPGYPLFIATSWYIANVHSTTPILIGQIVVFNVCLLYLLWATWILTNSKRIVLSCGVILSLSPLHIGWFRFVLTEPLAVSLVVWFYAELILLIATRRLVVWRLSIALIACVFVRPDLILMSSGAFICLFYVYEPKDALKKSLGLLLVVAIPVSLWELRSIYHEEAPFRIASSEAPRAPGYFEWTNTWMIDEYERANAQFPLYAGRSQEIVLTPNRFLSEADVKQAQVLLMSLPANVHDFPKDVDDKFADLSVRRTSQLGILGIIEIKGFRAINLLLNPYASWGMPFSIDNLGSTDRIAIEDAVRSLDPGKLAQLGSNDFSKILGKAFLFIYRLAILLALCLWMSRSFARFRKQGSKFFVSRYEILVLICLITFLIRLFFFIELGYLEHRYLAPLVPLMEWATVISLADHKK